MGIRVYPSPVELLRLRAKRYVVSARELDYRLTVAQGFNDALTDAKIARLLKGAPIVVRQNPRNISPAQFVKTYSPGAELSLTNAVNRAGEDRGASRPRYAWAVPVHRAAEAEETDGASRSDAFVAVNRKGRPVGFTAVEVNLSRSGRRWLLYIDLNVLFVIKAYRGRGFGLGLQNASQEFLRALYERIAVALPPNHQLACLVYADYESVQGERAARGVCDELMYAREILIEKGAGLNCELEEIELDAGY